MSARTNSHDDTIQLGVEPLCPSQPPSIDPAVLRRAMNYGIKARTRLPASSFHNAEPELRAGWVKKGEATEWDWVRAAVRAGFEQDSPDDD